MGSKTVIKWPKKITPFQVEQLIRAEKDVHKAILIFDSATAEYSNGFRHDHNTYKLMISKLLSSNQFTLAEELLKRMKDENNFEINEDVFLSICRAYGRVHKPLEAVRVFKNMKEFHCEPSQKSYITVFSLLVDENQLKVALRFYRHMRQIGIPLTVTSLNVLIKALCKNSGTMDSAIKIFREMPNRGYPPDSYTYGTLINGFCRFRKLNEAKELFKEMKVKGCLPSVVTYTSLINGLSQSQNLDDALEYLEEMTCKGIHPNVFTYSSLMDGLCKSGYTLKAVELLEVMIGKGRLPNLITYSTLINGLCKEGKIQIAVELLDRMKIQNIKPDAGLYSKIINGFCQILNFNEAANFLDEMVLGGITPNRLTWSLHVKMHNTVVQGLSTKKHLDRGFQLYLSMRTRGISVDFETFSILVNCFCKKGDSHKAAHIVDEMVIDGCVPDESTWHALIGGFWGRKKVREAAELVQAEMLRSSSEPSM